MYTTRIMPVLSGILSLAIPVHALANSAAEDAHGQHAHDNHAALFVGDTHTSDSDHVSIGLDYERRLPVLERHLGVVLLAEAILESSTPLIFGVGAVGHPVGDLRVVAIPGVEIVDGHGEFLMRFGAGYDFHLASVSVSPTANIDLVGGHVAGVFGASFGVGF